MEQTIITANDGYAAFDRWIADNSCHKILLVCDDAIRYLNAFSTHLDDLQNNGTNFIRFCDFQPNPQYESIVKGVEAFRSEKCDSVIAVGGGSAMDVAKCIKLYAYAQCSGADGAWLKAQIEPNAIPFLAMPTTAGTGSEATRFAVIYYDGTKQSVASESFIPKTVLMDPNALKTLPIYQKKATMCDALCHAIESYWSVNSTECSRSYAEDAIKGVLKHMDGYLKNSDEGNAGMLLAAHTAGKAINITQTTAGHAMCYKITGMFGAAHGHAAMLCNRVLYPWMIAHTEQCIDPRGQAYLTGVLQDIGHAMGCDDAQSGAEKLNRIFDSLGLSVPTANEQQIETMVHSVNPDRLKNFPVALDESTIKALYHLILNGEAK